MGHSTSRREIERTFDMIRYKDFETGRKRFTRGSACGLAGDGLGIERLIVSRNSDELHIPLYCLDAEGRKLAEQFRKSKTNREGTEASNEASQKEEQQSGENCLVWLSREEAGK
jgi:hypothetical protein